MAYRPSAGTRQSFIAMGLERERIHVDRNRPVSQGALERQPHPSVLLQRDVLLRDRRPQDVAQNAYFGACWHARMAQPSKGGDFTGRREGRKSS